MSHRLKTIITSLSFIFFVVFLHTPQADAQEADPKQIVDSLHSTQLEAMKKGKEMGKQGRFEHFQAKLPDLFNFRAMIQIVTGTHWRNANEEQRDALAEAFSRNSAAIYADRFNSYSGQQFEILEVTDGPRGTKIVRTEVKSPGKSGINLSYVMRKFSDDWRIIDVLAKEGVSQLATLRSEYKSTLDRSGITGLTETLESKTKTLL